MSDIVSFIGNTLRLLRRSENRISSFIGFPNGQCQECNKTVNIKSKYIYQVDMKFTDCKEITITDILRNLVISNGIKNCCLEFLRLETEVEKYVIFDFLNPISIKISAGESIWGKKFAYISHDEQKNEAGQESQCTFFRQDGNILYQNRNEDLCRSDSRIFQNVKVLAILFSEDTNVLRSTDFESPVYETQTQKYLRKKYLSVINPEEHQVKQLIQKEKQREWDKVRNQTDKRKKMLAILDKERDQTLERKQMPSEGDKI